MFGVGCSKTCNSGIQENCGKFESILCYIESTKQVYGRDRDSVTINKTISNKMKMKVGGIGSISFFVLYTLCILCPIFLFSP